MLLFVLVLLVIGLATFVYLLDVPGTGSNYFSSVENDVEVVHWTAKDAQDDLAALERTAFEGMTEAARRRRSS